MIRITQGRRFQRDARELTAAERTEVEATLRALSEAFGNPHVPAGLGIRRLRDNAF